MSERWVVWVDDNPLNNEKYKELATKRDIHVTCITNTDDAIKLLRKPEIQKMISNGLLRIISDWHRVENGVEVKDAGQHLLDKYNKIPVCYP